MKVPRTLLLVTLVAIVAPADTTAEVLVACPADWRPAMANWVAWRAAQGHEIRWVEPSAMTDPAFDPPAAEGTARTLILVGDGRTCGPPPSLVPAVVVSRYGPEASIATDHPLATRLKAQTVARWPVRDRRELEQFSERVIRRATAGAPGAANLRVAAGVGGFAPWIDAAIEATARRLVTDLAPARSDVSLRRYPSATDVGQQSNERGGVWVWLGHGTRDALPGIEAQGLTDAVGGADLAVLLACYAGDFAAPGSCVAERLLRAPEGPVAVIASTRVSMPYGNARLGAELLAALGREPTAPVGELFGLARDRAITNPVDPRLAGLDDLAGLLGGSPQSLPAERADHGWMYHLLGDPLLVIDRQGSERVAFRRLQSANDRSSLRFDATRFGRPADRRR